MSDEPEPEVLPRPTNGLLDRLYASADFREELRRLEPEYQEELRKLRSPGRKKFCYIGAPAVFLLEQACQHVNASFGDFGCYVVGSALERADWRDVDVRFIMADELFAALFPRASVDPPTWEQDPRWLLLNTSIAGWLKQQTGLPVDFQIQPQSHANARHPGVRQPVGR